MSSWKPNIFDYLNYREYLGDYYDAAKENVPAYSYRYFARRARISSPSFLRHVIRDERNLGDTVDQFADALELSDEERRYFKALVEFNQAEDSETRNRAFEKVSASRRFRGAKRLEHGMFEYLSHWYFPAIREMVARPDFSEDAEWIASQLVPAIEPDEASEALEILLELGMIVRSESGELSRGESSVATEHEVRSLAIANYHRQMLHRAGESIELVDRQWRDLGAMTACVSTQTLEDLKHRIHEFRELVLQLCDTEQERELVIQFNSQLFPLSRVPNSDQDSK